MYAPRRDSMQQADLLPPDWIWWTIWGRDLRPKNHSKETSDGGRQSKGVQLFEVLDARKVFGQIVFMKDMLRCVTRFLVASRRTNERRSYCIIVPVYRIITTNYCTIYCGIVCDDDDRTLVDTNGRYINATSYHM
jgi:hypothetical protein